MMLTRRTLFVAVALATVPITALALSPGNKPYNQAQFDAAQAAGRPILIEVTAPWCSVCKAQAPILARLKSDPKFKDMVAFEIDFDSQKDLLRKLNVRSQSTLIVFKGKAEVGRSTGDTNPASIAALLGKAV
jgi:thiol-disulfide isomerase/thioredoxin